MPQLEFIGYPFASQLFWLFISFGILYIFSAKFFIPRIGRIQTERNDFTKNSLADAISLKEKAEAAKKVSTDLSLDAKNKASSMLKETEAKIAKIQAVADDKIKNYADKLERELIQEKESYIIEAQPMINSSASEIAKFILEHKFGRKISEKELTKYTK